MAVALPLLYCCIISERHDKNVKQMQAHGVVLLFALLALPSLLVPGAPFAFSIILDHRPHVPMALSTVKPSSFLSDN